MHHVEELEELLAPAVEGARHHGDFLGLKSVRGLLQHRFQHHFHFSSLLSFCRPVGKNPEDVSQRPHDAFTGRTSAVQLTKNGSESYSQAIP